MLTKRKLSQQTIVDKRKRCEEQTEEPSQKRAGTVTRMVLRNFMCHSLLEVNFDNNIMFITGRNGSGKSAILTALVVGLGGKASATNRGTAVKSFIKVGKPSASVEITLKNEGPLAFDPRKYGNEITIIRHMTQSSNTYRIKNATGQVVATRARDVHELITSLNIQIDNPVCVLNQDTARNFLNSKDTQQKFYLFTRATGLEFLDGQYAKVVENRDRTVELLLKKEKDYDELKKKIDVLQEKLKRHETILIIKDKLCLLQRELLWAKVRDSELNLQGYQENAQKLHKSIASMTDDNMNQEGKLKAAKENMETCRQNINEIMASANEEHKVRDKLEQQMRQLMLEIVNKKEEKTFALTSVKNKTNDTEILEKEIENSIAKMGQIEQEKSKRMEEMATVEKQLKDISSLLKTSENDQFQFEGALQHKRDEARNLKDELAQTERDLNATNERLKSLKNATSNTLLLYGRDMPKVVNAINAAKNKFKHLPRGPLGSYINLNDKKWAVAIEGYVGAGLLRGFAVDNKHDNDVLSGIFDQFWSGNRRPLVIISKFFFKIHDVSRNLVHPADGCTSIYATLDITDPVVANCLIDQAKIERILLIPNNNVAMHLMSDASRVPRNCIQGITMKGESYFPDPDFRTYGSRYHNAQYLQVNPKELMKQIRQDLEQLTDKKQTIKNQLDAFQADWKEQQNQLEELKVKISKLNRSRLYLQRKHEDIGDIIEPDAANTQILKNEIKALKDSIAQCQASIETVDRDIAQLQVRTGEVKELLHKKGKQFIEIERRIKPFEVQIAQELETINQLDINGKFTKKRLDELQGRLKILTKEVADKEQIIQTQSEEAQTIGDRLENLREVCQVSDEINNTKRSIRQIEGDSENIEQLVDKLQTINEQYENATLKLLPLQETVQELDNCAEDRKKLYHYLQDYFKHVIMHKFQKVLELRQFQGTIDVDFTGKNLEMTVSPQQGSQGATVTKNLSGGERSFSTVAFLYALWQCNDFPFYFLDEFDVFMDKVNRTKVFEILIHHAKSAPNQQFIFFTPQDISFIADERVAIHRLEDPERNGAA